MRQTIYRCTVHCGGAPLIIRRRDEIDRRGVQRLGQFPQADHRGVAATAFKVAEILLREARTLGQLLLRQAAFQPDPLRVPSHNPAHVHAPERGRTLRGGLSTLVCIDAMWCLGRALDETSH